MSVPEGTTIRQAYVEDIPTILRLIVDLAAYEKEPASTVEATPAKLLATIAFAPTPNSKNSSTPTEITPQRPARCLLLFPSEEEAKAGGKAAGLALYYYTYSTWRALPGIHLEDLYVGPEWRGKGFGRALLAELAKEVLEKGGARLEWDVLKWNEPSIKFYEGESVGAERMEGWVGMRVDGEKLAVLAAKGISRK